jgi:hypothetical protein
MMLLVLDAVRAERAHLSAMEHIQAMCGGSDQVFLIARPQGLRVRIERSDASASAALVFDAQDRRGGALGCALDHANSVLGEARNSSGCAKRSGCGVATESGAGGMPRSVAWTAQ